MSQNYYQTLGIPETASAEEIKAAYRKLAMKYHPDRNPGDPTAKESFKNITAAYDILSDPEKKRQYDSPTEVFVDDIFAHRAAKAAVGENVQVVVDVTLADLLTGVQKEVTYHTHRPCATCQGSGGAYVVCERCGGKGSTVINTATHGLHIHATCHTCHGQGRMFAKMCNNCNGAGLNHDCDQQTVTVNIPAGMRDTNVLMFNGEGHPNRFGAKRGRLQVRIRIKEHPFFTRLDNGDLGCKVPVSFSQLILGDDIDVPLLNGSMASLKVPAGTQSGRKFRLPGFGLPVENRTGHLYVELMAETPVKLKDDMIGLLEKMTRFDNDAEMYPQLAAYRIMTKGSK